MAEDSLIFIAVNAILIQNFVLVRFLGICPFLGVSKKTETAFSMGMAVTFVMVLASVFTWLANRYLLVNPAFGIDLSYLQTITFIVIIAALVQLVEMFIRKVSPPLYNALGIYLPLITTNCAVLGVAVLNIQSNYDLLQSIVFSFCAALGFTLAIVLMSGVRERLRTAKIPEFLQGFPIALITAGLIAMSFLGFSGLSF